MLDIFLNYLFMRSTCIVTRYKQILRGKVRHNFSPLFGRQIKLLAFSRQGIKECVLYSFLYQIADRVSRSAFFTAFFIKASFSIQLL